MTQNKIIIIKCNFLILVWELVDEFMFNLVIFIIYEIWIFIYSYFKYMC